MRLFTVMHISSSTAMNMMKLILVTFFTLASAITLKQDSIAQHPKSSSLALSRPDLQTINVTRSARSYQPRGGLKKERREVEGLSLVNSSVFVTWHALFQNCFISRQMISGILDPTCLILAVFSSQFGHLRYESVSNGIVSY